ncbi:unnamed protein product (macronuclear) [Paramecium tetraurelia]|uniref:Uncharacterized protein n=1 Tax=Paramecium tetraurelia TaxID=5888 RepID=A0DCK2_PARTE|nr:uncharacterized protein GSPATT00015647001 [Paramecium tetraurelia]CAK80769.1 unnamed protein product [Paramecium tetraurelia]|eukprot:XP_001448166.1 hypothetical protein (macronuclear) [Paramecium tetraurelia strain d4-2]
MSNQEINELNALQVLDYDIFGKCNDLMSFIKTTQPILSNDPQIKVKIGAVAKLINMLLKLLKDSDSSLLSNQPEYHDIIYIINNNLQWKIKQYEEQIKKMSTSDAQSNSEIINLKQEIQKLKDDGQAKTNEIAKLNQEIKALKHISKNQENQEDETLSKMQNEIDSLSSVSYNLQNEVKYLKLQLKQKEEKIQDQEGKINQQMNQINRYKNDQSQDRKNDIFYEQQQIFQDNDDLRELVQQLENKRRAKRKINNEEVKHLSPQEQAVQYEQQNQEINEIQNKIFGLLNRLSTSGIILSATFVAFILIQYLK